ncbi:hypothetical protein Tco_0232542 [Tanacetum coccineum]
MSKLRWSRPHNLLRPSSVRVDPIVTVCSGYSGFIATLTLSSTIGLVAGRVSSGPETNAHFSGTNLLLFKCSYSISEADPPSTYMRCMQWPPISASMIIGHYVPSYSSRGGKRISVLGEKLCAIFFLATLSQGWTIRMAAALSFLEVSPFFATLGAYTHPCYAPLFHRTHKIWCDSASRSKSSLVAEL